MAVGVSVFAALALAGEFDDWERMAGHSQLVGPRVVGHARPVLTSNCRFMSVTLSESVAHNRRVEKTTDTPTPIDWSAPSMTPDIAFRALGIGRPNGYRAIKNGDIPAIRIGGRIVVPTAVIRRMLQIDEPSSTAAHSGTDDAA